jgi:GxxExxY protein
MDSIIHKEESYKIMGACFEVYKTMGPGFLEAVYLECLEIEFAERGIPFGAQRVLPITYKSHTLQQIYKADFVCYDSIIIELKAASGLSDSHRSQVFNYLRATGLRLGILANFGAHPQLEYDRIVL